MPSGCSAAVPAPPRRPLANSVPTQTTTAASSAAFVGWRRVVATSNTSPIHVNWNSSVMATLAGMNRSDR